MIPAIASSRYVNEFTFRLKDGDGKGHTLDRLASFVDATVGAANHLPGTECMTDGLNLWNRITDVVLAYRPPLKAKKSAKHKKKTAPQKRACRGNLR